MIWSRVANERGNVLLFTIGLLVLMLVMGGIAVDLAYYGLVDNELQRATDAAALAGAGNLDFNSTPPLRVRTEAQRYAALNRYRDLMNGPTALDLNLNTANDPTGDIVLGHWDPSATPKFTPSPAGNVNAVLCRTPPVPVPTTFFRLIGITTMTAFAESIAIAGPPAQSPACLFPVGLSSCFFGGPTAAGCGATITFISSGAPGNPTVGVNSGAWISLDPSGSANANDLRTQIGSVAAGTGCSTPTLSVGNTLPATNGMQQSVYNDLMDIYPSKYNASPTLTVLRSDGSSAYTGQGWEVYVPVIDTGTSCPPGAIPNSVAIAGFTRFVITQVSSGGQCAVANHNPTNNPWDSNCWAPGLGPGGRGGNGTGTSATVNTAYRGIYGYFDCTYLPGPPVATPAPITALAQRLRLVQ
jgi:hypothetical protein